MMSRQPIQPAWAHGHRQALQPLHCTALHCTSESSASTYGVHSILWSTWSPKLESPIDTTWSTWCVSASHSSPVCTLAPCSETPARRRVLFRCTRRILAFGQQIEPGCIPPRYRITFRSRHSLTAGRTKRGRPSVGLRHGSQHVRLCEAL